MVWVRAPHGVVPHRLWGRSPLPPYPPGTAMAQLGMGCFWGAERLFWSEPGVWVTAVGYGGGHVPDPDYETVCGGATGHAELVLVVFDPRRLPWSRVFQVFWEGHDPTQGMRQGNDRGSQYRSVLAVPPSQLAAARASRARYQAALTAAGWGEITTKIRPLGTFYLAEPAHQQYHAAHPGGYCGLQPTGVAYPRGGG